MRFLAAVAFATCLLGQPSNFRIVSPAPDSVFRPGDVVTLAIETTGTYQQVMVLPSSEPDNVTQLFAPAYRGTLRLPSTPRASEVRLLFAAMRKPGDADMEGVRIFIRPDYRKESDSGDAVVDDPGITVDLRANPVMHRSPVRYPTALRALGIAGTVVVEVRPDWEGQVDGRFALSGPPELRRQAVLAVGDWHFAPEYGDHSRQVAITFDPWVTGPSPRQHSACGPYLLRQRSASIVRFDVVGMSAAAESEFRARVSQNQDALTRSPDAASNLVHNFDHDLILSTTRAADGIVVRVAPPGFDAPCPRPPSASRRELRVVDRPPLELPPVTRFNHVQGVVSVNAQVGPNGRVTEAYGCQGPVLLCGPAEEYVKRWVYEPPANGNERVTAVVEFYIDP